MQGTNKSRLTRGFITNKICTRRSGLTSLKGEGLEGSATSFEERVGQVPRGVFVGPKGQRHAKHKRLYGRKEQEFVYLSVQDCLVKKLTKRSKVAERVAACSKVSSASVAGKSMQQEQDLRTSLEEGLAVHSIRNK